MRKLIPVLVTLFVISSVIFGGCAGTPETTTVTATKTVATTVTATTTVTAPPTTITTTVPPITVSVTATVTATPTPTPTTTSIGNTLPANAVTLTDPTNDLFNTSGTAADEIPFLDITSAAVFIDGSDYVGRITVSGNISLVNNDPKIMYAWDIFMDTDNNPNTGDIWNIVHPGLGDEYYAAFVIQGDIHGGELVNLNTDNYQNINYTLYGNVIELRWPCNSFTATSFNFTVAALKFNGVIDEKYFLCGDRAPNTSISHFPKS